MHPTERGRQRENIARSLDEISKILDRVDRLLDAVDNEVKSLASQIKGVKNAGGVAGCLSAVDGIASALSTLEKDVDPRAQTRGKEWKGALAPVRTALGGLKGALALQRAFDLPLKRCRQMNGGIQTKVSKIKNEEALERDVE